MAEGGRTGELVVEKLNCSYEDYYLESLWFPGRTLSGQAVDELVETVSLINHRCRRPLRYGVFDSSNSKAWQHRFFERSIWCIVYHHQSPCGFAYQYDLGTLAGRRVIHSGLVEFSTRLGPDIVLVATVLIIVGNLVNFGRYLGTNITHMPSIAGLFWGICDDVYPSPGKPDTEYAQEELRLRYLPGLKLLTSNYIEPILGCKASAVCARAFRIEDSLAEINGDFVTRWEVLTKGRPPLHCQAMESRLRIRSDRLGRRFVTDDLIQVGIIDCGTFSRDPAKSVLRKLAFDSALHTLPREWLQDRLGRAFVSSVYPNRV